MTSQQTESSSEEVLSQGHLGYIIDYLERLERKEQAGGGSLSRLKKRTLKKTATKLINFLLVACQAHGCASQVFDSLFSA